MAASAPPPLRWAIRRRQCPSSSGPWSARPVWRWWRSTAGASASAPPGARSFPMSRLPSSLWRGRRPSWHPSAPWWRARSGSACSRPSHERFSPGSSGPCAIAIPGSWSTYSRTSRQKDCALSRPAPATSWWSTRTTSSRPPPRASTCASCSPSRSCSSRRRRRPPSARAPRAGRSSCLRWLTRPGSSRPPVPRAMTWSCERARCAGFEPRSVGRTGDFDVVCALAAAGHGVGLVPALGLDSRIEGLAAAPTVAPLARRVFAATRPGNSEHPHIAAVLAALGDATA